MTAALLSLGLALLAVLGLGLWLKRAQAQFVAALRSAGDPLAESPRGKEFRSRFQAWLFGLGGEAGPAPGRTLLTVLMTLLLGGLAAWSLLAGGDG